MIDADGEPVKLFIKPSGLFVLLKQKLRLSKPQLDGVSQAAASAFAVLIFGDVRSFV